MSKLSDFFNEDIDEEIANEIKILDFSEDLIKCPYCKDDYIGSWDVGINDHCSWCDGHGLVTQKRRMEYVRQFKGMSKEDKYYYFRARDQNVYDT